MDGKTTNTSPHKEMSTEANGVINQLRLRRVEKVIMAGRVGNLCLEAHVRDILEPAQRMGVATGGAEGPRRAPTGGKARRGRCPPSYQ
ncbi:hypothetical protein ACQP00_21970 [Dactylosporangium sp. CS-047395]|uniref:hypothetical protein n=1 Tax=Dactylosporangium sp. CS-047395 TaxID=3239936 RepID=UPI003D924ADE